MRTQYQAMEPLKRRRKKAKRESERRKRRRRRNSRFNRRIRLTFRAMKTVTSVIANWCKLTRSWKIILRKVAVAAPRKSTSKKPRATKSKPIRTTKRVKRRKIWALRK